jgi:hypothetical protein
MLLKELLGDYQDLVQRIGLELKHLVMLVVFTVRSPVFLEYLLELLRVDLRL